MDQLAEYRQAAITHGEATAKGNHRSANRAFDKLTTMRKALRQAGHAHAILTLLDDENVYVRKAAAVDALELAPDEGVRVLRSIAAGPDSPHQFSAETLLEQWEDGSFSRTW